MGVLNSIHLFRLVFLSILCDNLVLVMFNGGAIKAKKHFKYFFYLINLGLKMFSLLPWHIYLVVDFINVGLAKWLWPQDAVHALYAGLTSTAAAEGMVSKCVTVGTEGWAGPGRCWPLAGISGQSQILGSGGTGRGLGWGQRWARCRCMEGWGRLAWPAPLGFLRLPSLTVAV